MFSLNDKFILNFILERIKSLTNKAEKSGVDWPWMVVCALHLRRNVDILENPKNLKQQAIMLYKG